MYCIVLYCTIFAPGVLEPEEISKSCEGLGKSLYCVVLCCVVSYCIVLCCVVLYCVVLYCVVLCCAVLYCIVLCCIVLCCILLYCILFVLCCIVLYCFILCCINLLLAECEVHTAISYGPSFFLPFMAQARSARAMKTRKEKRGFITCPTD